MKNVFTKIVSSSLCFMISLSSSPIVFAQDSNDDEEVFELSPFSVDTSVDIGYRVGNTLSGTRMGATVGGAQDINYARSQVRLGNIPLPNSITAEGLFSEHNLPLGSSNSCESLICVYGNAMETNLPRKPSTVAIGQIGFSSGLDASTWRPEPLNLVAVVDKSGSMNGQPLELVKDSLQLILTQMSDEDQLSIVLYGDRSHVYMFPKPTNYKNRAEIHQQIEAIVSAGSTNLESGLKIGYQVAEQSAKDFDGNTRLMLFTDERPNVGNTSEHGFMRLMEQGSLNGIGLTTIGVGVEFGVELAQKVSTVRGGNLFYFPDNETMVEKFENDFDTMVTELAYEMDLTITAEPGFRISEVYGVPADAFEWNDQKSITLSIETLFLSRNQGALFVGFESTKNRYTSNHIAAGTQLAKVSLDYLSGSEDMPTFQEFDLEMSKREDAPIGLTRGEHLINEFTSLKEATIAVHQNHNYKKAQRIIKELSNQLWKSHDESLMKEIKFVQSIEQQLNLILDEYSNHDIEPSPINGKWIAYPENNPLDSKMLIKISENRCFEIALYSNNDVIKETSMGKVVSDLTSKRRGDLHIQADRILTSHYKSSLKNEFHGKAIEQTKVRNIKYRMKGKQLIATLTYQNGSQLKEMRFVRMQDEEDQQVNYDTIVFPEEEFCYYDEDEFTQFDDDFIETTE